LTLHTVIITKERKVVSVTEIIFSGSHSICDGNLPDSIKVTKVCGYPCQVGAAGVRHFLGIISYYE